MATPNDTVIYAVPHHGFPYGEDIPYVDVTDAVQALYDLAVGSLDFGSGFWTADDAEPVAMLARLCGFTGFEVVESYVQGARDNQEANERTEFQARLPHPRAIRIPGTGDARGALVPVEHDHAYSTRGNCMWPHCRVTK